MTDFLYLHHPSSLEHDTGAHPERAERIVAIERELERHDYFGFIRELAPCASMEDLETVHPATYIDSVRKICLAGGGSLDPDTVVSKGSWEAALHAAGAAVRMVDALIGGEAEAAFCGLRPPGHHAGAARAMGFCLFNNVAIAARRALDRHGLKRVLIFDWDVHHGNGTNDIFCGSGEVLYASIHQMPLYPGTGSLEEVGEGAGEGFTVNLPLPAGSGEYEALSLVANVIAPIARSFKPELVLVSAGYDGHKGDPLAALEFTAGTYAALASALKLVAGEHGAPLGLLLEGGYDLDALSQSVAATLEALSGPAKMPQAAKTGLSERAANHLRRWWPELP